jgi:thiamine biosynthesis lipoprotein ApbE
VATDGKTADGLATGLCVLGPARGLPVIEKIDGAAALYIVAGADGQTFHASKRFAQFQKE